MLHSLHFDVEGKQRCCNMMTPTISYSKDVINWDINIKQEKAVSRAFLLYDLVKEHVNSSRGFYWIVYLYITYVLEMVIILIVKFSMSILESLAYTEAS